MASTAPQCQKLFETSLRQGQIRHALKTALACCLATLLIHVFHVRGSQFGPLFAFLLLTLGMPRPCLNAILTQLVLVISGIVSALLLMVFSDAPFLYLAVTLLWIFTCMLFTNWFPLPASLGSMVSAIGMFVFFLGTVGETLAFYVNFAENFFFAGLSVVLVQTLIWPYATQRVLPQRLSAVYGDLEERCRHAARQVRLGESPTLELSAAQWAPFRPLDQLLGPEIRPGPDASDPIARIILACRALNLRLWFFDQAVAPMLPATLSAEARGQLAGLLERCAEHLHALLEAILAGNQVLPLGLDSAQVALVAPGVPYAVLRRVLADLQAVTTSQNALLVSSRGASAGDFVVPPPLRVVNGSSTLIPCTPARSWS